MQVSSLSDLSLVHGIGDTRAESSEADLDTFRSSSLFLHDAAHASEEVDDPLAALDADIMKPDEISALALFTERKLKTVMDGFAIFLKSIGCERQDMAFGTGCYERLETSELVLHTSGPLSLKDR